MVDNSATPPPIPDDPTLIRLGQVDSRGQLVRRIYSNTSGTFAVYLAADVEADQDGRNTPVTGLHVFRHSRVAVHYSDKSEDKKKQLLGLSSIRALRGQIDGLQDRLMSALAPEDPWDRQEAESFNQRVADALVVALQEDPDNAKTLLEQIKADLEERLLSLAKFQYCFSTLYASGLVLGLFLLVVVLSALGTAFGQLLSAGNSAGMRASFWAGPVVSFVVNAQLWIAALFGCLGAWFSIGLGIRNRSYGVSNRPLDNKVDAFLRVAVAVIAAIVLLSIVRLGLFSVKFGSTALDFGDGKICIEANRTVHVAIILSFLAGFLERLVGNILGTVAYPATPEGKEEKPTPKLQENRTAPPPPPPPPLPPPGK